MSMNEVVDRMEELLLDTLARIDDGDNTALNDIKKLKLYVSELNDMLSVVSDDDNINTIKKKFDSLNQKFEEFLMAVVKVVG